MASVKKPRIEGGNGSSEEELDIALGRLYIF
jgi:hypothetical protein